MALVHVEVVGRVQGVGFRWFIRERARELGVAGWVRNLSSGNVEIAAGGADEAVASFLERVNAGPPGAQVTRLLHLKPQHLTDLPLPFTVLK